MELPLSKPAGKLSLEGRPWYPGHRCLLDVPALVERAQQTGTQGVAGLSVWPFLSTALGWAGEGHACSPEAEVVGQSLGLSLAGESDLDGGGAAGVQSSSVTVRVPACV